MCYLLNTFAFPILKGVHDVTLQTDVWIVFTIYTVFILTFYALSIVYGKTIVCYTLLHTLSFIYFKSSYALLTLKKVPIKIVFLARQTVCWAIHAHPVMSISHLGAF